MAVLSGVSSRASAGVEPKGLRVGLVAVSATFSVTVSSTIGDVIQMVKVPLGATPVYVAVQGNGGVGMAIVGDGVSAARYVNNYSFSAASALQPINTAYFPYTYSTDDTIDITISAVTAGTLAGGWTLIAIYSMDPT